MPPVPLPGADLLTLPRAEVSHVNTAVYFFPVVMVLIAINEAQIFFFSQGFFHGICHGLGYREMVFYPSALQPCMNGVWVCPISPGTIQLKGTVSTSLGTAASW